MRYRVGVNLTYQEPRISTFVLNVAAAQTAHQRVEDEVFEITPNAVLDSEVDAATGTRYHRFVATQDEVSIRYSATVISMPQIDDPATLRAAPPDRLPLHLLPYLLPSRYCQSDQLMRLAYREFGRYLPGYAQIQAICNWIHENVDYLVGTTGPMTSAFDTATARAGVCRDFAHLGIAFCRAINIPARFVSGYAYGLRPPDFHAMFEAWLGDRWYLFDPTRQIAPAGMLRIGTGRDAGDVSFAFIFGAARMTNMEVFAEAIDAEGESEPSRTALQAITTA